MCAPCGLGPALCPPGPGPVADSGGSGDATLSACCLHSTAQLYNTRFYCTVAHKQLKRTPTTTKSQARLITNCTERKYELPTANCGTGSVSPVDRLLRHHVWLMEPTSPGAPSVHLVTLSALVMHLVGKAVQCADLTRDTSAITVNYIVNIEPNIEETLKAPPTGRRVLV